MRLSKFRVQKFSEASPVFNRLILQNVGLLTLGKLIRYILRTGPDVEAGLSELDKRKSSKANVFGVGYESGEEISIGCSYKGRVWSRRVANLKTLTQWCSLVGSKVINKSIDPDQVLRGTLVKVPIDKRPALMPIGISWPHQIYCEPESAR